MFYVGQRVVCIDDTFDPSIVEWADHLPRAGEVYTVRSCTDAPDHATGVPGPSFKLLEVENPRTEQGGEVTFSTERFEPIDDPSMDEAMEHNSQVMTADRHRNAVGQTLLYFGSGNDSGQLRVEEVSDIIQSLIQGGIIIAELEKREGMFHGRYEECLRAEVIYHSFATLFGIVQDIRARMHQDGVGMMNARGVYVRITADAVLCQGPTYIVFGHSAVLRDGADFHPGRLGIVPHKYYWVATNLGDRADEIGNLPKILHKYLQSWWAFYFQPGDDISQAYPKWIGAAVSVDRDTFLVWHPNQAVTAAGGPFVQILKYG